MRKSRAEVSIIFYSTFTILHHTVSDPIFFVSLISYITLDYAVVAVWPRHLVGTRLDLLFLSMFLFYKTEYGLPAHPASISLTNI